MDCAPGSWRQPCAVMRLELLQAVATTCQQWFYAIRPAQTTTRGRRRRNAGNR